VVMSLVKVVVVIVCASLHLRVGRKRFGILSGDYRFFNGDRVKTIALSQQHGQTCLQLNAK